MANMNAARQETPFDVINSRPLEQSVFDHSHDHKTTFSMGELIPFLTIPVQPADTISLSAEVFTRYAPLLKPIIHRVNMELTYFYVPNRILWRAGNGKGGWQEFISEPNGTPVNHATFTLNTTIWDQMYTTWNARHNVEPGITPPTGAEPTSLLEYMGFRQPPTLQEQGQTYWPPVVNALPIAAYWKIWNDYYRRPQIQNEYEPFDGSMLSEGENNNAWNLSIDADSAIKRTGEWLLPAYRNWNLDIFTAALPTPQAGTEVLIPMTSFQDSTELIPGDQQIKGPWQIRRQDTDNFPPADSAVTANKTTATLYGNNSIAAGGIGAYLDIQSQAATIRQFRLASATQSFLEKLNRTGDRYRDIISGFFGSDPMAGVLDYAEYLGKSSSVVAVSDVMTQSNSQIVSGPNPELDDFSLTGSYAGKAMAGMVAKGITYTTPEHGWVIGLINVQPVSSYRDNTSHFWYLSDKYDYPWQEFANIGDEEVKKRQLSYLYVDAEVDYLEETFGYTARYNFWRYTPSYVSGEFKDVYDYWHLARDIGQDEATLDTNFLECRPRYWEIFQVGVGTHEIFCHIWNKVVIRRSLPKYGMPKLI